MIKHMKIGHCSLIGKHVSTHGDMLKSRESLCHPCTASAPTCASTLQLPGPFLSVALRRPKRQPMVCTLFGLCHSRFPSFSVTPWASKISLPSLQSSRGAHRLACLTACRRPMMMAGVVKFRIALAKTFRPYLATYGRRCHNH